MLAQQGNAVSVNAPNNILDGRCRQFGQCLLLLNIEQDDRSRGREQERGSPSIEDLVGLRRQLDGLGQRVVEIPDLDRLQGRSRTERDQSESSAIMTTTKLT